MVVGGEPRRKVAGETVYVLECHAVMPATLESLTHVCSNSFLLAMLGESVETRRKRKSLLKFDVRLAKNRALMIAAVIEIIREVLQV